ncbi:hypothetical protein PMZ80_006192 [Knufia obscura]|uniref:Uncharacterized protein n=1 Tax=Knufia obscura TaxID=1635080 RepID=A0ABR0RK06_9EURO|nr:hypothetical protein PMZ80_006192 [Knufia obscura]
MAQKYGLGGLDGREFLPSGGWIPGMLAGWRGCAHVKDGRYSVVLDNVVSHMESDQLQLALGKGLAKMTVEPNLTMVNKQKKDHGHLSTVLQHVHGVTIPPEQAEDILLDYYASIANICLDIKTDITTVPGDEDKFEWQDAAPTDDFCAFSEILAAYYRITYEDINGNQHRIGGVNFFFDVVDGTMQIDDKKSSVNPEEATVLYWILRALKATSVYNIPKDILDQKTTCRFVGIPSPTRAE